MLAENKTHTVQASWARNAHINAQTYKDMYVQSVADPTAFWSQQAKKFVDWIKPWDKVLEWDYRKGLIRWFEGAKLNVSANCIDRHLKTRGEQIAIIWEGDNPAESAHITYNKLHHNVSRLATCSSAVA